MQGAQSSGNHPSPSLFQSALANSRPLFTPKRVGFYLAGAFVCAGAAAALGGVTANHDANPAPVRNLTVQAADTAASPESTGGDNAAVGANAAKSGSATNRSNTNIKLNVNGQNIAVPANGSTQQTVPTSDGNGQSSVSVNTSSNSSSSSLNVNVSSSSTSSGTSSSSTTVTTQNGDTTATINGD